MLTCPKDEGGLLLKGEPCPDTIVQFGQSVGGLPENSLLLEN